MKHHKPAAHILWQDPCTPRRVIAQNDAIPDETREILDLIDTAHPSWPDVAAVLREYVAAGVGLDKASVSIAVKIGRQRWEDGRPVPGAAHLQMTLANGSESIVYYIRRGNLVKIGTTTNPYERFRDLMPDEILAFEPGARRQEDGRHRQFRHLQVGGEYFRDDPELRKHIETIRAMHGAPDPDWPTSTNLGLRKITQQAKAMWRLPSATSTEIVTAAQAIAELGIKEPTLRAWVHRGLLQPVGREGRRHLYYREHLVALRDSPRAREVQRL